MTLELQAQGLTVQRERRVLLQDINLTLVRGQLVALVGANGAGKSTLLRTLTGYLSPSQGQCLLNGRPLQDWSSRELARQRAVMRQHHAMTFSISAREVVALGRAAQPSHRDRDIVEAALDMTDAQALAPRNYLQLSGGEQQRIQLARVLAQLWHEGGPRGWLFLDEPTSALDLHFQQHTLRLFHALTRSRDLMICAVLHDLNLAALWADRVVVLHAGKLVADGTPEQVLQQPALATWYEADVEVSPHPQHGRPRVMLQR